MRKFQHIGYVKGRMLCLILKVIQWNETKGTRFSTFNFNYIHFLSKLK